MKKKSLKNHHLELLILFQQPCLIDTSSNSNPARSSLEFFNCPMRWWWPRNPSECRLRKNFGEMWLALPAAVDMSHDLNLNMSTWSRSFNNEQLERGVHYHNVHSPSTQSGDCIPRTYIRSNSWFATFYVATATRHWLFDTLSITYMALTLFDLWIFDY